MSEPVPVEREAGATLPGSAKGTAGSGHQQGPATLANGVLTAAIRKTEESKPRKIEVK